MSTNNVIVSGIQPSGRLHIGNYVGAIKNWLELQNGSTPCYFFIVDYHSITGEYSPEEKRAQILDVAIDLLALGLDPKKCVLFVQSYVPEHTELAWILNTVTPVSFLERMTQFKDKADQQSKNINMGLFDYPVLQAADILLYHGTQVPVGIDQVQHVELTRAIARFFNNKYGDHLPNTQDAPLNIDDFPEMTSLSNYFPETKPLLTDTPKLRSLTNPLKKMSKSHGDKSYIALTDSPEDILAKMKRAVTEATGIITMTELELEHEMKNLSLQDEGVETTTTKVDPQALEGMAGVWNLLTMLRVFGSPEEADRIRSAQPIKYGDLKVLVAERIAAHFADFRTRRAEIAADPDKVRAILAAGAEQASKVARATMEDVRKIIGVR